VHTMKACGWHKVMAPHIVILNSSFVGIVTKLLPGQSGFRISAVARDLSLPPKCPHWLWSALRLLSLAYYGLYLPEIKRTHPKAELHLVPSLSLSGAMFLSVLCAFVAWTRSDLSSRCR
jgi:hypothetical protein